MKSDDSTLGHVLDELRHHAPFTAFSACVALILLGILTMAFPLSKAQMSGYWCELFHVFHPVHILFSATATTAMFWRHERRLLKAVIIGLIGALVICALSDVFFPVLGGELVGIGMEVHWCLIKHPTAVVPFAIFGVLLGVVSADVINGRGSTIVSHSSHVFISTITTMLYLMAFGFTEWIPRIAETFLIIFLSVVIPCCISDIIFPTLSKSTNTTNDSDGIKS
ncbi:MAG: hypothetical protein BME93_06050 [Methanosarcinales archaeon Met12]|nr:MAG: hypothetical protein BME93_06050 [Methanosarcinales archaeon Met12]